MVSASDMNTKWSRFPLKASDIFVTAMGQEIDDARVVSLCLQFHRRTLSTFISQRVRIYFSLHVKITIEPVWMHIFSKNTQWLDPRGNLERPKPGYGSNRCEET